MTVDFLVTVDFWWVTIDFLVTVVLWWVTVDFWNAIVNLAIVDEARFVSLRNVFVQVSSHRKKYKSFCQSHFPYSFVNLSFIITYTRNKFMDLCGK